MFLLFLFTSRLPKIVTVLPRIQNLYDMKSLLPLFLLLLLFLFLFLLLLFLFFFSHFLESKIFLWGLETNLNRLLFS